MIYQNIRGTEFSESVKYYNGTRSPIRECKEKKWIFKSMVTS